MEGVPLSSLFEPLERKAKEEGIKRAKQEIICKMLNKGKSPEQINELIEEPLKYIYQVQVQMRFKEKYEQGMQQGIIIEKNNFTLRMLEDGKLSMEEIVKYSGLTIEQIEELRESHPI